MQASARYCCPLCPRAFDEDPGLRVHLTETHQLYDYARRWSVYGAPAPSGGLDLLPEPVPEPQLEPTAAPQGRAGRPMRIGPLIAIAVGLVLIIAALFPR